MRTSTSARVQKHRAALRESGLRPVQIWVPDTRRAGFAEECRRQSRLLQGDAHERETAEWLEAAADREGWQ
ncbi:antitoxin MazE [mine drainage metagenome]|uniref:Antitoxin MazE n=1 Tax=mine drainage metagenome TaxID=410659 RepID=A0A1J5SF78_9ZZZZ